ncbi:MAG: hypothetical protein EOO40_02085, partial [Deltaproteobacteria bacterium]
MAQYGLLPQGFVLKRQADCLSDLLQAFLLQFGSDTDLGSDTYLGQVAGVFSERHALLWEALQDVVNSQNPNGAEGVFVDNILALAGLTRGVALPTRTNPSQSVQQNGLVLSGLVLYGTPGTSIDKGTLFKTQSLPTLSFTLDDPVTIQPAQNGLQTLVFSQVPTQGTYTLTLVCPSGSTQTTAPLSTYAQAQTTQLVWPVPPTQGTLVLNLAGKSTQTITAPFTALKIQAALQALPAYMAATVAPTPLGFAIAWPQNQSIPPVAFDKSSTANPLPAIYD